MKYFYLKNYSSKCRLLNVAYFCQASLYGDSWDRAFSLQIWLLNNLISHDADVLDKNFMKNSILWYLIDEKVALVWDIKYSCVIRSPWEMTRLYHTSHATY